MDIEENMGIAQKPVEKPKTEQGEIDPVQRRMEAAERRDAEVQFKDLKGAFEYLKDVDPDYYKNAGDLLSKTREAMKKLYDQGQDGTMDTDAPGLGGTKLSEVSGGNPKRYRQLGKIFANVDGKFPDDMPFADVVKALEREVSDKYKELHKDKAGK